MEFSRHPQRAAEGDGRGFAIGPTTVMTLSPRVMSRTDSGGAQSGHGGQGGQGGRDLPAGLAVAGGSVVLPGMRSEERLLLGLVDGRLSVARLARLSGLSEEAAVEHLRSLCARRMVVPVPTTEVTIRGNSGEPFFRLGPYEVASRLGQGGMGSVYVCRRTGAAGFRRLFALKVVRQGSGQEQAAEKSFLREIRVGVLLDHPNTQSLVDVGMYKNQPFLVLQYIEGTSLEEVSFGRRVPPAVLITILIDVLRGLQRAHEISDEEGRWLGLVHGDVSAPNILIGTDGVARLTDFGSARFTALGETGERDPMTLGKPAYMAPEQLLLEPLDARTDLFAIGTVMWSALTGQELFAADDYEQIVANVLHKEIELPSDYGAPACLDEICLRALSRSRARRPATAEEMATALLKIGVDNGLLASPAAVGAYLRREVTDAVLERRQRIDAAFQEAVAPAVSVAPPIVTVTPAPPVRAAAEEMNSGTMPLSDRVRRLILAKPWLRKSWLPLALWATLAVVAAVVTVAVARHRSRPAAAGSATAGYRSAAATPSGN